MLDELKLVRTRSDLQKILDEIDYLSRSGLNPDDYFARVLQLSVVAIGGQGAALWVTHDSAFRRVCQIGSLEVAAEHVTRHQQGVEHALREAVRNVYPLVVRPTLSPVKEADSEPIHNGSASTLLYVPVMVQDVSGGKGVPAVLQAWVAAGIDAKHHSSLVGILQAVAKHVGLYLRTRQIESVAATTEKLQQLLRFAAEINGQLDLGTLGVAIVNWSREICGCDRVALFEMTTRGRLRPVAVSNVEVVDPRSSLVQAQRLLGEDTLAVGQITLYRKSAPKTEAQGDLSDYFYHSGASEALAIPLAGRDQKSVGLLLLESNQEGRFDEPTRRLAALVARSVGPALATAKEVARLPFLSTIRRLERIRAGWRADPRRWVAIRVGVPLGVLAIVALFPWPFSVGGECTVQPAVRGVAVCEVAGRVTEILVGEGERVRAGQPLARIDDTALQQMLLAARQEQAKFEAEANRLQVLGDEGGRRLALLQAALAERQARMVEEQLAKTTIVSPLDGVVLTQDLRSRFGERLAVGERFCTVASLERWEVYVQVRESDVALVDDRLRAGRIVPLEFVLRSLSGRKFTAEVRDREAISLISYQVPRANVYLVRAELPLLSDWATQLKAGYTGRAELRLGWRPAGYVMTRRFWNYLRVHWLP